MKTISTGKNKYKENFLLLSGISIFILFTGLSILLDSLGIADSSSRTIRFNEINIFQLIIAGVFIAPIFEELAFRGMFAKKKFLKYISYSGMIFFILSQENYYLIPVLATLIILFELKERKHFLKISYFVNALLFSMMHYKFSDILNISSLPGILGTVGLALILIWLVLNFGLLASVMLHFITNLSLIGIAVIGYENLDQKIYKAENDSFEMTIQRVSLFEQKETLSLEGNKISAQNSTISTVYSTLCPDSELKNIHFGKFNINIRHKNGVQQKIDCKTFIKLVEESKINQE